MDRFRNARQPDWGWWARLWPAPGETLRQLGLCSGDVLAEVCSGNGYFALPAARIVEPAPVYALDVDEALLEELRSMAELQATENVAAIRGDARTLTDHLPSAVDVVLLANAFHGVGDREGLAREAYDALRPGGRLIVVNWIDRPREETTPTASRGARRPTYGCRRRTPGRRFSTALRSHLPVGSTCRRTTTAWSSSGEGCAPSATGRRCPLHGERKGDDPSFADGRHLYPS